MHTLRPHPDIRLCFLFWLFKKQLLSEIQKSVQVHEGSPVCTNSVWWKGLNKNK